MLPQTAAHAVRRLLDTAAFRNTVYGTAPTPGRLHTWTIERQVLRSSLIRRRTVYWILRDGIRQDLRGVVGREPFLRSLEHAQEWVQDAERLERVVFKYGVPEGAFTG